MLFLFAVLAFSGVTLAFLYVERIHRRPDRPAWLESEYAAMPISVGFTAAFACSFAWLLSAALTLPLPLWGDVAAAFGVVGLTVYGVRALFRRLVAGPLPH